MEDRTKKSFVTTINHKSNEKNYYNTINEESSCDAYQMPKKRKKGRILGNSIQFVEGGAIRKHRKNKSYDFDRLKSVVTKDTFNSSQHEQFPHLKLSSLSSTSPKPKQIPYTGSHLNLSKETKEEFHLSHLDTTKLNFKYDHVKYNIKNAKNINLTRNEDMIFKRSEYNKIHMKNLSNIRLSLNQSLERDALQKERRQRRWEDFKRNRIEVVNRYIDQKRRQRMAEKVLRIALC